MSYLVYLFTNKNNVFFQRKYVNPENAGDSKTIFLIAKVASVYVTSQYGKVLKEE